MSRDVLILAECAPQFGMGHLSRCLVLADALRARGAAVRFALTTPDCMGHARGFPAALAAEAAATDDLLIVDGYRIPAEIIAPFAARARITALVDDTGDRPRPGDILVNYQLYALDVDYSLYPATRHILGPLYFAIRPGLAELRHSNQRGEARPLLAFGAGATGGFGFEAARALARRFAGPIDLAIGAMGPPDEPLPANVTLHRNADFIGLMARATLYAGAIGTSFAEALAAGLPAVGAAVTADQIPAIAGARALGVPVLDHPDAESFAALAAEALDGAAPPPGADILDGKGADRLAEALLADSA